MAYIENKDVDGVTHRGLEFYKKYREGFGKVIKATMEANPQKIHYIFTLENSEGEKMVFNESLTSGYSGEGPSGTYEVLKDCGFHIAEDFVEMHTNFVLENK